MSVIKERLVTAQWILERQLAWIAAAEVKVGALSAFNLAMLGALAAAFGAASGRTAWATALTLLALAPSTVAIVCAALSIFPRLSGPDRSLMFFGKIMKMSLTDYSHALSTVTDEALLADWSDQIHRNAEIAAEKHAWVRLGMIWSFLAVVPWFGALLFLTKF